MRLALFVDFENVFSSLRTEAGEAVAVRFANDPLRWLRWIEQVPVAASEAGSAAARRVLVRTCYLNPSTSGRFRSAFTSAGFRVVDCPSVTLQGKNSADIHMVMDILDALAHPTRFDEFVILSGDADFRPVLLRLRAHDRRSVILTVGPSSSAYENASDQVIRSEEFVEQALGFAGRPGSPPEPPPRRHEPPALAPRPAQDEPRPEPSGDELRLKVERELAQLVLRSTGPIPLARAAHVLTQTFGDALLQSRWFGHRSFRRFVEGIEGASFRQADVGAGFLFDPERHVEPGDSPDAPRLESVISPTVDALCRRTGTPRRTSREYGLMFAAIDAALRDAPYQLMDTSRQARDLCVAQGAAISRGDLTFVLRGLWGRDAALLRRDSVERSARALARSFCANVLALAEHEDMSLSDVERAEVTAWIVGEGRDDARIVEAHDAGEIGEDLPRGVQ